MIINVPLPDGVKVITAAGLRGPQGAAYVGGGGAVSQVNGKTGEVTLSASDVGADPAGAAAAAQAAAVNTAAADAAAKADAAQTAAISAADADAAARVTAEANARTSAISAAINALIDSAPGTLNTLGEIAAALISDESVTASLISSVAGKLSKAANLSDLTDVPAAWANLGLATAAGKTFGSGSGQVPDAVNVILKSIFTAADQVLTSAGSGTAAVTALKAGTVLGRKAAGGIAALTGADVWAVLSGQASADVDLNGRKFTNAADPASPQDLATQAYVLAHASAGSPVDVQLFAPDLGLGSVGANTWTPPGFTPKSVRVHVCGAGGGGGSGTKQAAGVASGGGAGGGPGELLARDMDPALFASALTVTIGAGGTGGAAITANSTAGINGTAGAASSIGSLISARGGAATTTAAGASQGGVAGFLAAAGDRPQNGGGGNGGSYAAGVAASAGAASGYPVPIHGPWGGGGGCGITAANAANSSAGLGYPAGLNTAGVFPFAVQTASANAVLITGPAHPYCTGGAGGASLSSAVNGGNGKCGSGGGGGAASRDSVKDSGKGGDGGNGFVLIVTIG